MEVNQVFRENILNTFGAVGFINSLYLYVIVTLSFVRFRS